MQPEDISVQYSRWQDVNQDEVSMVAAPSMAEASSWDRISRTLCWGKLSVAVKVLGAVALFWAVFILGYITGYYVHKCK